MYNINGVRLARRKTFCKLVSKDMFPKLKDFTLKMHAMFGRTNVCESAFSTMKQAKSKNRNQSAHETLDDGFRSATANILASIKERKFQRPRPQVPTDNLLFAIV